jgi:hypothetical protein
MKQNIFLIQLFGLSIAVAISACGSDDPAPPPPPADPFVFSTQTPDRFVRVDRMGEPALATALLNNSPTAFPTPTPNPPNSVNMSPNQRDAFNRGEPTNDTRDFAGILTTGPQPNSLRNIHFEVGPSLRAAGLTPCSTETVVPPANTTQVNIDTCVAQAAPVILPDVITFDFGALPNPGWPNGRSFDDPVVDRLLAAALLRISGPSAPHNINTLVGVINPTGDESGTPSPTAFPHLRPAHS